MPGRGQEPSRELRRVVYCLIPRALASRLHEPLRRHFARDESVEVVVERRAIDRRTAARRRAQAAAAARERRLIRAEAGRRVADRRAALLAVDAPVLPRRARPYAPQLVFVERLEPSHQQLEDEDTARLVARIQSGDREGFAALYMRYFDRVYAYLRVALRDPDEAEDLSQQVFVKVLDALPRYELRSSPFRAWLFTIVRNCALSHLGRQQRIEPIDPAELGRRRVDVDGDDESISALQWVTDRELFMLIERLPLAQRQVLVLRFMMSLSRAEIAAILGCSQTDVRNLQYRALRFLRERLTALGRAPGAQRPIRMRPHCRPAPVLRGRRFALLA